MTGLVNSISGLYSSASSAMSGMFDGAGAGGGLWSGSPQGGGGTAPGAKKPSLLETIANGMTLASAGISLFASNQQADGILSQANQQARAQELNAQDDLLDAKQEEIKGQQAANDILRELRDTIATQRLTAAVNGVDPSFGTPVSVENSARKIASLQLGVSREDALLRSLSRRKQAYARQEEALNIRSVGKQEASASRLSGLARAAGTIGELAMRRSERG